MVYLTKEIKPNNKTIDGSQEVLGTGEWQILELFNMTVVATTNISRDFADKIVTLLNNGDNNKY